PRAVQTAVTRGQALRNHNERQNIPSFITKFCHPVNKRVKCNGIKPFPVINAKRTAGFPAVLKASEKNEYTARSDASAQLSGQNISLYARPVSLLCSG
ncbi:MAG: hypothetical protein LUE87_11370, partial [Lachnospiraceae bacterium]|nr:hypothetical protein [Lachnospiraceae bacterium]